MALLSTVKEGAEELSRKWITLRIGFSTVSLRSAAEVRQEQEPELKAPGLGDGLSRLGPREI